jgi:flotillin
LRAELERRRLEVEVTIPAEAARRAAEARARAEAAPALEAGKATAQALRLLAEQWGQAGALGRELYVLQHLDELVAHAAERVAKSTLGELSVVDGGDGQSYAQALAMYPAAVARVMDAVGAVLGTDMKKILSGEPAPDSARHPLLARSAE